jgi:hypothetical protein
MSPFRVFLLVDISSCVGELFVIFRSTVIVSEDHCAGVWRINHLPLSDIHADVGGLSLFRYYTQRIVDHPNPHSLSLTRVLNRAHTDEPHGNSNAMCFINVMDKSGAVKAESRCYLSACKDLKVFIVSFREFLYTICNRLHIEVETKDDGND